MTFEEIKIKIDKGEYSNDRPEYIEMFNENKILDENLTVKENKELIKEKNKEIKQNNDALYKQWCKQEWKMDNKFFKDLNEIIKEYLQCDDGLIPLLYDNYFYLWCAYKIRCQHTVDEIKRACEAIKPLLDYTKQTSIKGE